jgi:outer membrane immunogenic protein
MLEAWPSEHWIKLGHVLRSCPLGPHGEFKRLSVEVDMKCASFAAVTCAALMVAVPATAQNWSGPYIGASIGAEWIRDTLTTKGLGTPPITPNPALLDASLNQTRARFGGYAGYNWQFNSAWVAGIEGGLGFSPNAKANRAGIPGVGDAAAQAASPDTTAAELGLNGNVRARLGFLITPTTLIYGTGGVAFQQAKYSLSCTATGTSWCLAGAKNETQSATLAGWTLGAGAEMAIAPKWLLRLDYGYSNYGSRDRTFFAGSPGDVVTSNTKLQTHDVTLGLAYKF